MPQVETGRFTVGVFQDVSWAQRGIDALIRHGFAKESLAVLAKDTPEVSDLLESVFPNAGRKLDLRGIGPVVTAGSLVEALRSDGEDVTRVGLGRAMRRVGFQEHDGYIFETLTARGGVLVAVCSEPRAADALAVFHAYGGGNAAIGAWTGRL